jgi:hypothetical protein
MVPTEEMNAALDQATDQVHASPSGNVRCCDECGTPMVTTPALRCRDCGERLYLRCFVRRAGNGCFIAECIDLDISAEGDTLKAAIAGLQDALCGYLDVAITTDSQGLALRPSPLTHRARYHLEYLKYRVAKRLFPRNIPKKEKKEKFYQFDTASYSHC